MLIPKSLLTAILTFVGSFWQTADFDLSIKIDPSILMAIVICIIALRRSR